jgi:hypothetical protein
MVLGKFPKHLILQKMSDVPFNAKYFQAMRRYVMSFKIELLPNEPILRQVWAEDYSVKEEAKENIRQIRELLDSATEPVFFINDMRFPNLSLDDIIIGANVTGRGEAPIFQHPNIRQVIFISESKLLELGARGMKSATFGNVDIKVFKTPEEAMAHIHAALAEG